MDFDGKLKDCDLVITGEGRFDSQSIRGKVVSGVSRRAKRQGVAVSFVADFPSKIRIDDIAKNTRNEILPVKFDENGSLTMA